LVEVGLVAALFLAGCRSAEPHFKAASRVPDVRDFPLGFSPEEVITRTWTQDRGQRIELLRKQVFTLRVPEPLEVMVATFGVLNSNRAVCIDFYAAQEIKGGTNYYLLCHDQNPPAYNTKVSYEEQNKRSFFNVEGQDQLEASSKRSWRKYYYGLNRKCDLMRGMSEIIGPPTE
jgi:hypothetical protein